MAGIWDAITSGANLAAANTSPVTPEGAAINFGANWLNTLEKLFNSPDPNEFFKQLDINKPQYQGYYVWCMEFAPEIIKSGDVWDGPKSVHAFENAVYKNFYGLQWPQIIGNVDRDFRPKPNTPNINNIGANYKGDNMATGSIGKDTPEGSGVLIVVIIGAIAVIFGPKILAAINGRKG